MTNYIIVTILVKKFDETINFYINALNFEIDFDNKLDGIDKWVVLKHKENKVIKLSLKIAQESENHLVGNQTGDQSLFNLHIEDLNNYYKILERRKIAFDKASSPYADYAYLTDNNGNNITLSEFWINDW